MGQKTYMSVYNEWYQLWEIFHGYSLYSCWGSGVALPLETGDWSSSSAKRANLVCTTKFWGCSSSNFLISLFRGLGLRPPLLCCPGSGLCPGRVDDHLRRACFLKKKGFNMLYSTMSVLQFNFVENLKQGAFWIFSFTGLK